MQEILLKRRYFERGLSKSFKNIFFSFKPSPVELQDYEKMGPGTSDQSHFRLQNKFRKIPLLVIYYRTKLDDVI